MLLSKKRVKKIREDMLEIVPEITGLLEDIAKISGARDKEGELSEAEAADNGIMVIKETIDMLLVRRYDGIIKILAVLYETKPDKLEEKEVGEVVGMIEETLTDELLMRFFPQLRRLARKTP